MEPPPIVMPEQHATLQQLTSISCRLQTTLHSVITIQSETDRASLEKVIIQGDIHCMLSEIIGTAQEYIGHPSSPLTQLVLHHVCCILLRIHQQVEEIFVLTSRDDQRWIANWRPSRIHTTDLVTSFQILRCRFSRLLTVLP